MAVKFLTGLDVFGSIDLNQNTLIKAAIESQANNTAAGTGVEGQLYFDSTLDVLKIWAGGAWEEVGGGVTTVTTTDGSFINLTPNTATSGAVTVTADLSATGTPSSSTYLRGDNSWATIPAGYSKWRIQGDSGGPTDVTDNSLIDFAGGTNVTTALVGGTLTINSTDQFTGTVTSVAQTHGGLAISVVGTTAQYINGQGNLINLNTLPQGTVTSVNVGAGLVKTGTAAVPIISVDYTSVGVIGDAATLTGDVASGDLLLIGDASNSNIVKKATFSQIPLDQLGAAGEDVNLGSNKIINLANGTASTDAINLGQLNTAVAGLGVFRGAYNAATNTPNLDTTSNVAANQGDFWVVSVDGTFFTTAVEVGDFIFANEDIPVNSGTNALSKWTVVAADQNVAGVGTTSGNTEIGVAGFNSATFSAAANGWISVKAGGISDAQLASTFNKIIGIDTDINTSGVEVVDQISLTDGVVQVTPATLAGSHSNQGYSNDLPSSAGTTWDIVAGTHGLGTGPFIVQTYEVSGGAQVFMDVEIAANGTVTFSTQASSSIAQFRCNILKV